MTMDRPKPPPPTLSSLPNELLLCILETGSHPVPRPSGLDPSLRGLVPAMVPFIHPRRDEESEGLLFLARVCRVSQRFNRLATPYLYKKIRLNPASEKFRYRRAMSTLCSRPHLAAHCESLELIWDFESLDDPARWAQLKEAMASWRSHLLLSLKRLRIVRARNWGDFQREQPSKLVRLLSPLVSRVESLSLEVEKLVVTQLSIVAWPQDLWKLMEKAVAGGRLKEFHLGPGLHFGLFDARIFPNKTPVPSMDNITSLWIGGCPEGRWQPGVLLRKIPANTSLQHFAVEFNSFIDDHPRYSFAYHDLLEALLQHRQTLKSLALPVRVWYNSHMQALDLSEFETLEELYITSPRHDGYKFGPDGQPGMTARHMPPRLRKLCWSLGWRDFSPGYLKVVTNFIRAARNNDTVELKEVVVEGKFENLYLRWGRDTCARLVWQWHDWGVERIRFVDDLLSKCPIEELPRPVGSPEERENWLVEYLI